MIARLRPIAVVAALFALGGAPALAQEDSVLQRYDLAVENLEFAVQSVPGDALQARDELERAVNALLTLSRDTTSATLVDAMQRTFESARLAVDNQSKADLAVQAAVLRGGFRRLVADSAYTAGAEGDLTTAGARLNHLAEDMGFSSEDLSALQAAGASVESLRLAFEAGTAGSIAAELEVSGRLLSSDRAAAYEALATAYGDSLLIQDSPRADPGLNQSLLNAAQALVSGDDEAFAPATTEASAQLSRLASAARAGDPGVSRPATPEEEAGPATPAPADQQPGGEQAAAAEQPAAPAGEDAAAAPATPGPEQAEEPAQQSLPLSSPPEPDETPAAGLPSLGGPGAAEESGEGEPEPLGEAALALARAQFEQEQRDARLAALVTELETAGLPGGLARTQAQNLLNGGFETLAEAHDDVAAKVNEAVGALRNGDRLAAEAAVADAQRAFGALDGVLGARDSDLAAATRDLFAAVLDRPALRVHDLTLLAAQVEATRPSVTANGGVGLEVERNVDAFWSGWPRLVVVFVLGLLAFVPLRYLNLAFGGGNANWRMVAWALFLLLLPFMYEALAALGSVLADLTDTPDLDVLSRWSMFTSTLGHIVWAGLGLIALLFATAGLRGIAAQFGLLGGRGAGPVGNSPTLVESSGVRQGSAVDWDDEF
ncbi:MAG TPA: hypothetical protein VF164_05640 [Trueperaceae bacterium]